MDMDNKPADVGENKIAALFDLDGTILDTEGLYTEFWNKVGREYLNMGDLGKMIKGQTLNHILDMYFVGRPDVQSMINDKLYEFEYCMNYDYVPGAEVFLKTLKENGIAMALVTSSNQSKMCHVFRARPEMKDYFDVILTGEQFKRSKPAPDCFGQAMEMLCVQPENAVIFEDSIFGLQAAKASGGFVFGLTTTNSREEVEKEANVVIADFTGMTVEHMLEIKGGASV